MWNASLSTTPNTVWIRLLLLLAVLLVPQLLRLLQKTPPKPLPKTTEKPHADTLSEMADAMRKTPDEIRPPQEFSANATLDSQQGFPSLPSLQPESTFIPSVLLVALVLGLAFLALQHWLH